ncbi:MAG: NADH-quinone oxidoreductase subunit NuoF [Bacteriovoracaceae bacterium]|nr:NADH-quinone oxidoreductase subunit NuoF [Bacteriovoracaceae bacterium]
MKEIIVGTGTCGISAGADKVLECFHSMVEDAKGTVNVKIGETGCMGVCYREVLVNVLSKDGSFLYGDVTPEMARTIFEKHILSDTPVDEWIVIKNESEGPESDFIAKQKRIVLGNCGRIDPLSIKDYINASGYEALKKSIKMTPDEIIELILNSGLRGRGGAGFLTGQKWRFAQKAVGDEKYVVCNADEGDPGAFMDRSVLEGDPHSVLEGMIICGLAIGAQTGIIYCRAEYPRAINRLEHAIKIAREHGFLGENIQGSSFSFDIKIKEGAGAFVCGEETALIASIEGQRGTPRIRPPFPATSGLWGKPTNINNVETFANISWIIRNGASEYSKLGTQESRGTKVFAMAGKVKRSGLVEVPMGITINEIVFDICGGIKDDRNFKAVQMGGPSGGCIPASMGEIQIDYQKINMTGAIMGSGGMIVVDETTCMVELARFFLEFTQRESCGKCTSCRVGTLRMLETLENIVSGKGKEGDIERMEELGEYIKSTAQCGLGQTAPNPVLTTIKYFRDEYDSHIIDKKCPAHSCEQLIDYTIDADKCKGCTLCIKSCPVGAISGEPKKLHVIDPLKCIKCGKCYSSCRFEAILKD